MTPAAGRICIALDFGARADVLAAARRFAGRVGWVKVGLEAFVAEGPSLVSEVAASAGGAKVFLDLKFHDIPATVAGAVTSAQWPLPFERLGPAPPPCDTSASSNARARASQPQVR